MLYLNQLKYFVNIMFLHYFIQKLVSVTNKSQWLVGVSLRGRLQYLSRWCAFDSLLTAIPIKINSIDDGAHILL